MIHDIFITTFNDKLLYGNNKTYPLNSEYPLSIYENKKLHKLIVNDVILSILYSQIDNFSALKFLNDLKKFLESKNIEINENSIKNNYFEILSYLQNIAEIGIYSEKSSNSEDVYIDIYYKIHTLLDNKNNSLQNYVYGDIISNVKNFKMKANSEYEIKIINESKNENEIVYNDSIKFNNLHFERIMFIMNKKDNTFIFESEYKGTIKNLEIKIPIGKTAYQAKIDKSNGKAVFDLENGIVKWTFSNYKFQKESITLNVKKYEQEEEFRSIMINFTIEDETDFGIKIQSCEMIDKSFKRFWVKNTVCSGHYEIRQF